MEAMLKMDKIDIERSLQKGSSGEGVYIEGKGDNPILLKRNLQSLGCTILIRGGSACLFLGQPRGLQYPVASCTPQTDILAKHT